MSAKDESTNLPSQVKKSEGRPKVFAKILGRVRNFTRKKIDGSSKDSATSGGSSVAAESSDAGKAKKPAVKAQTLGEKDPKPTPRRGDDTVIYASLPGVSRISRSALFEERAKKLGQLYGLDIKAVELQPSCADDTVLRIDRPIRMRIRRTCHVCTASFASNNTECPACQHQRCNQCIRYPPKRTEAEKIASRERRDALLRANKENAPIIPDYSCEHKEVVLTRPSKTGGQDLIYKKPRQRVRRTCHECKMVFVGLDKTCKGCGHIRCTDCPRDPSKKDKYPFGYPGDAFGPNSVPHYECEKCRTIFPTGAEHGTACRKCNTEKSDASPRAKPRKVHPEPDPAVMKSLEARFAALEVKLAVTSSQT